MESSERVFLIGFALIGVGLLAYGVGHWSGRAEPQPAASRVHVPAGQLDTDYAFLPGGPSGGIELFGLPSLRLLRGVPVFAPDGAAGYATSDDDPARRRLQRTGGLQGDLVALAIRDGALYAADRLHGRVARVALSDLSVTALARVDDLQAATDVVVAGPDRRFVAVVGQSSATRNGLVALLDHETLQCAFQIALPGPAGRCAADPAGRWLFVTVAWPAPTPTYMRLRKTDALYCVDLEACKHALAAPENWLGVAGKDVGGKFVVELVHPGSLAARASLLKGDAIHNLRALAGKQQGDKVRLAYTRGAEQRHVEVALSAPVLGARGVAKDIPLPLQPGTVRITPAGKYVLVGSRATGTVSVIAVDKLSRSKRPSEAIKSEVQLGNGPIDSAVDARGRVYTALYEDSQVVQWRLDRALAGRTDFVTARTRVPYRPVAVAAGTTTVLASCAGAGRQYLPSGPVPQANLVLLGARDLAPLTQTPAAYAAGGALVKNAQKLALSFKPAGPVTAPAAGVERDGTQVTVTLHVSRGRIEPAEFEVESGDRVTLEVYDIDPIPGIGHGLAVSDHAAGAPIPTGGMRRIRFTAGAPGTYWYYETRAASIAAPETRGLMAVKQQK